MKDESHTASDDHRQDDMGIAQARLRDVPALAWTTAQAFAAASFRTRVRTRACSIYIFHLSTLIPLTRGGQLWHGNRKALIGISLAREKEPLKVALAVVIGIAVVIAVLQVVPPAVLRVGAGVLLPPAVVPALCGFHLWRSAVNNSAIERWKKTLPGRQFSTVAYLAMYPQTGEGFTFALAAIKKLAPSGSALYTEAHSRKHLALYKHAGLQPLPGPCGTTTLAMGTEKD